MKDFQIGGNPRSRCTIQSVEQDIYRLKSEQPHLTAIEIRQQLIKMNICAKKNAPSVPSINRFLKTKGFKRSNLEPLANSRCLNTTPIDIKEAIPNKLKYSIDSILNFGRFYFKFKIEYYLIKKVY